MANIFPRSSNLWPIKIAFCVLCAAAGLMLAFSCYANPKTLVVGYQPAQPIPFSHKIHVGQIGMDCRYCHSFVEISGHANIPPSNTCWNCHQHVQRDSPLLTPLRKSIDPAHPGYDGKPLEWTRVHKLPDYVYFNHSAHVNRGVSCQSCHGNVNSMQVVSHDQSLAMDSCLTCHRSPDNFLRPLEEVYNFNYDAQTYLNHNPQLGAKSTAELGLKLKEIYQVNPKITCATCHR